MSLVEQELLTLPEHLRSSPVFSGIRVTRSLCLYVCFVDRYLSFCTFFFWPLCCLFFFDIRFLITPLWYLVAIVLSVLLRYTDSDYPPLVSCGHCVVCSSSIYGFWWPPFGILWPLCCLFFFDIRILITPLWYLQTFLEDTKAVNGRRTDNTMNTSKKNKFIKYNTVTCILEYLMINSWDEKFKDLYKKVIRSHKSSKNR